VLVDPVDPVHPPGLSFPPASSQTFLNNGKPTVTTRTTTGTGELTRSALLDLLCRDGKNRKHLNHDFDDHVCHPCRRWHFDIRLKTPEEVLDPLEDFGEYILAIGNGLSRLPVGASDVRKANVNEPKMTLTERRTPIPVKMTPAGGYTYIK